MPGALFTMTKLTLGWGSYEGARASLPTTKLWSVVLVALLLAASCSKPVNPDAFVMLIENSPTNLDPRVGIDAQSERIGELLFDALLTRDEHLNVKPGLAERWELTDPLTYVFHLHSGVTFHDGRPLTSKDVKWTFDSLLEGKIRSTKSATYKQVEKIETPDDLTVVFKLKQPFATLPWNLSEGAIGIVPYGSGDDISRHPIGSGPFKFVSAEQDKDVILERNDAYWAEKALLSRVRFMVVPDATTRALELRKGSADAAINALTSDMVLTLEKDPRLEVIRGPGTVLTYLSFNLRDPLLRDVRVRQAIACAINRAPMIEYLWRGFARPASKVFCRRRAATATHSHICGRSGASTSHARGSSADPARNGTRFRLTIKTSTDESARLLAAVLQQQLRDVGIDLDIRTFEFATFFADVTSGAFQAYALRWIGGNEDPDIFEYVYHSAKFAPKGANRASMLVQESMGSSTKLALSLTMKSENAYTHSFSKFSPRKCRPSICGTWTRCWSIRNG
jgi:peptide/nickel transport system substrate-binding protein